MACKVTLALKCHKTNRFISYVSASNPGSLLKQKCKLFNSSKPTLWPRLMFYFWLLEIFFLYFAWAILNPSASLISQPDCRPQEIKLCPPSVHLIPKGCALWRHLIYNLTSFNFFILILITQVIYLAGTAGSSEEFISSSFHKSTGAGHTDNWLFWTSQCKQGTKSWEIWATLETEPWGGKHASPMLTPPSYTGHLGDRQEGIWICL